MSGAAFRPRARSENLVVEELDDELLVYDSDRDKAHCLNGVSALVWKQSDGRRSVEDLARMVADDYGNESEEVVLLALRQLWERRLILEPAPDAENTSRRELLRKLAIGGAIGLSIPLVKSIVAPTAAQAATCKFPGAACTASAQCCSGVCTPSGFCL
jgi:hypothetical protein